MVDMETSFPDRIECGHWIVTHVKKKNSLFQILFREGINDSSCFGLLRVQPFE